MDFCIMDLVSFMNFSRYNYIKRFVSFCYYEKYLTLLYKGTVRRKVFRVTVSFPTSFVSYEGSRNDTHSCNLFFG